MVGEHQPYSNEEWLLQEEDLKEMDSESRLMNTISSLRIPQKESDQNVRGFNAKGCLRRALQIYLDNYILLILSAAACMSLNATCVKVLTRHVSVFQVVTCRSVFGLVVIFGICHWRKYSIAESRQKVALCCLRGIVGGAGFLCWGFSAYALPLSESAFMTNGYPVVTAVLSWLLGMEHLGILSWAGVLGCVIGNTLMAQPSFLFGGHTKGGLDRVIGLVVAGITNVLSGAAYLIVGYIGKRVPGLVLVFYLYAFTVLLCAPFLIAGFPKAVNTRHSFMELLCYAGVCCGGLFVQAALTRALQIGPPTKVTALFLTNALFSGFIGIFVLEEKPSWISIMGSVTILVSVVTVVLQRSKKGNREQLCPNENSLEQTLLADKDSKT